MRIGHILGLQYQFSNKKITFAFFSLSILLFALGDGIFSYQIPLWLDSVFHNVALVGIVMSSSSLIGLICDLAFPTLFAGRDYRYFTLLTFIVAAITQLVGLVLANWFGALIMMILWGIYYECFLFGQYHFLHTEIEPSQHASGWGVAEALHSFGLIISPLIVSAAFVLAISPFAISTSLFGVSIILSLLVYLKNGKQNHKISKNPDKVFSFVTFRAWSTFLTKIWPVYTFYFCLIILDATIWTAGIFFAESLRQVSFWGAFLIPAYSLPILLVPLVAGRFAHRFGKKHTAFVVSIPLTIILVIGNWVVRSPLWHILIMLLAGSCMALILTESEAIFEDYVARLHRFSGEMVGLVRSASNIGYILGPLIAGFSMGWLGSARTVALVSILPGIAGVIALLKMRGKTQLPQAELEEIAS